MRVKLLIVMLVVASSDIMIAEHAVVLPQAGKEKKDKGKGKGGPKGVLGDANKVFDYLARGRDFIVIAEANGMRQPLEQFARDQGITSRLIGREEFALFCQLLTAQTL